MFNLFKEPTKEETASIDDLTDEEKSSANNVEVPAENRVDAILERLREYDEENQELSKTWEMPFTIEKVGSKNFIHIGDVSFCAEYVSDVSVTKIGKAPSGEIRSGFQYLYWTPEAASNSKISVTLVSGRTHVFECNRHCTETMLTTIRQAVRDAAREGEDEQHK